MSPGRRTLGLLLVVAVLAACSSHSASKAKHTNGSTPHSCAVSSRVVSGCGVWWGAYVPPGPDAENASTAPVLRLERSIGRRLAIVHRYHDMSTGPRGAFPDATEQALGKDRLLYIGWASRDYNGKDISWQEIADGRLDASVIDPAARRVAAYKRPLFLDFDHEAEAHSTDGEDGAFVRAYRHIHDRFEALGATNAVWVWTVTGFADYWDRYPSLYPGDSVVDWVAWDPYDFGSCHQAKRRSFADTISPFYDWLVDHHPSKPFMLGEYGTVVEPNDPQQGASWYGGVVQALKDRPRIRAVVQFDHQPTDGRRCDTRLRPASVLHAFANAGHDDYVSPPLP